MSILSFTLQDIVDLADFMYLEVHYHYTLLFLDQFKIGKRSEQIGSRIVLPSSAPKNYFFFIQDTGYSSG